MCMMSSMVFVGRCLPLDTELLYIAVHSTVYAHNITTDCFVDCRSNY